MNVQKYHKTPTSLCEKWGLSIQAHGTFGSAGFKDS